MKPRTGLTAAAVAMLVLALAGAGCVAAGTRADADRAQPRELTSVTLLKDAVARAG